MKRIHTSILDILLYRFDTDLAYELTDNILEYGIDNLRYNAEDYLLDYLPVSQAKNLADQIAQVA